MHDLSTTLAAVATARGPSGIGCVRISGPDAYCIAAGLCRSRAGTTVLPEARLRFVTLVAGAIALGALAAGPGEFTYRAVRHGRLDLAAAEAVRDLVAARTGYQARVAFAQVNGAASRRVAPLKDALIDLVARAEAAIEFADESETHLDGASFRESLASTLHEAATLAAEARTGRLLRRG